ncbi:M56 family metallopeptidase [Cytophagaceae bacterium YF14B1]|uniref:M56 family metallopeptidase n=1 Tax=Xanthocytophaga flava TaxID=3048013 RepID=A0AAE3QPX9_9BACT|nr:M56 family metallopeptidase [Xanthocytophaga flavus]MDJ1481370.1 M56 family metallopeptidase [Xanthocytophaga flavus]
MPFLLFLVKSSFLLGMFFGLYWAVLRFDTFHHSKRWVLLGGLVFSILIPLVKTDLFNFVPVSGTKGVSAINASLDYWLLVKNHIENAAIQTDSETSNTLKLTNWLVYIYSIVSAVFAIWFIIRVWAIVRLLRSCHFQQANGYKCGTHVQVDSPFSFFGWILLPPSLSDTHLTEQVLAHESAHARQWHTVDILLAELYTILFWFNPVTWLYKQHIRLNLEFLADNAALQTGIKTRDYQLSLLKINTQTSDFVLTNHFHHSSLKSRIHMMNRNQSSVRLYAKYSLFPVLTLGLFFLFQLAHARNTAVIPISLTDITQVIASTSGNIITPVKQAKKNQSTGYLLKGWVKDTDTGKPIAGAIIYPVGETYGTTTARDGDFTLNIHQKKLQMVFKHPDYLEMPPQTIDLSDQSSAEKTIWMKIKPKLNAEASSNRPSTHTTTISTDPLYIVDGKKVTSADIKKIDRSTIEAIDVLKGQKAIDKYGEEGKNGVVIITLKQGSESKKDSGIEVHIKPAFTLTENDSKKDSGKEIKVKLSNLSNQNDKNPPLYIVDDKQITKGEMDKIDPQTIESINVLKDESATKKYGDKGKNGVIEINLKKK